VVDEPPNDREWERHNQSAPDIVIEIDASLMGWGAQFAKVWGQGACGQLKNNITT